MCQIILCGRTQIFSLLLHRNNIWELWHQKLRHSYQSAPFLFHCPIPYSTVPFHIPLYSIFRFHIPLFHSTVFHCIPLSDSIFHCSIPHSTVFHCPIPYSTIFHCPIPYSTIFHCPIPYSTVPFHSRWWLGPDTV